MEVAISSNEAFELPPDFLNGIELMTAVSREIDQLDAGVQGQPFHQGMRVVDRGIVHNDKDGIQVLSLQQNGQKGSEVGGAFVKGQGGVPLPGSAAYIPAVPEINEQLLVPPVEAGKAPRRAGHDKGVDVPSSGKGIGPASPLQTESGTEVNYETMQTEKQRRKDLEDRMRRKPNSRSLRYRPLDNDPTFDPLDKGYENWLKGVRGSQAKPADVDPDAVGEKRFVTLGMDALGVVLVVVHTQRGERTRLISARKASRGELEQYHA